MSAVPRICAGCGQPIEDMQSIGYAGLWYHVDHVPQNPSRPEHVLVALRLIAQRASANDRENITLGDIEWTIQELKKG